MKTLREILSYYTAQKRPDAANAVREAWFAGIDSVRAREIPELEGCGDSSCVVAPPKGMHTNGGCRCDERRLRRAVMALRADRDRLTALSAEGNPHVE